MHLFTIFPFDYRLQNLEKATRFCFLYYLDTETSTSGLVTAILKFRHPVFMQKKNTSIVREYFIPEYVRKGHNNLCLMSNTQEYTLGSHATPRSFMRFLFKFSPNLAVVQLIQK